MRYRYQLEIKDEARLEIIEAYLYYEREQRGLGERFLTHLDTYFKRIREHPTIILKNGRLTGKHLYKHFLT